MNSYNKGSAMRKVCPRYDVVMHCEILPVWKEPHPCLAPISSSCTWRGSLRSRHEPWLPSWRKQCIFYGIQWVFIHYSDVIMGAMTSQTARLTIVFSTIYSGADQRRHQSSTSLAFVQEIHRSPVNSPNKGPVTWKIFPFDDVIKNNFLNAIIRQK